MPRVSAAAQKRKNRSGRSAKVSPRWAGNGAMKPRKQHELMNFIGSCRDFI
ncbi:MAG: hypothetical protein ACYTBP_13920 [Planctomycetota bacterium]